MPDGADVEIVLDNNQISSLTQTNIASYAGKIIPSLNDLTLNDVAKLGYARIDSKEQLFILPHPLSQVTTQRKLELLGWHTRRIGLLIEASRGEVGNQSQLHLEQSIITFMKNTLFSSNPLMPVFFIKAKPGVIPLIETPITLIGSASSKNELHVFLFTPDTNIANTRNVELKQQVGDLRVTIPGQYLSALPPAIKDQFNQLLLKKMNLKYTKPDIATYISQFESVDIFLNGGDYAISALGAADSFSDTVVKWLQEEERRTRPVKKAFLLPDGTLGYEKIPGETQEVLNNWQNDCRSPIEGRSTTWLCAKQHWAAIGSNETTIRLQQEMSTPDYILSLLPQSMLDLGINDMCQDYVGSPETVCDIRQIVITSKNNSTLVNIEW